MRMGDEDKSQFERFERTLTPAQVDALYDGDEVLSFVRRVNLRAVQKACWDTDFRRAVYEAFSDEANLRLGQIMKTDAPRA